MFISVMICYKLKKRRNSMFSTGYRKYRFTLMLLILFQPLFANYTFLGNVQSHERIESGIILNCDDQQRLKVTFLQSNMLRIQLIRKDFPEAPLTDPLARTDWQTVSLTFNETPTHLILRSAELELIIQKKPCRLTIRDKSGNIINQDDPAFGIGWDGKEVRCWKTITADEMFFGLGEKVGNVNKRGSEWVMWNSDHPGYSNSTDPLYQSIPFFIGMRQYKAYGIYFNNSYRSVFNMGAGNYRYFSFAADQGNMDYFFIYGPRLERVVETYTELTGRMPLPPKWALGYQQCRWSYFPDHEVLRLAETFRDKRIPADVIYLDIHYMDNYRIFSWDRQRFPDPAGLMRRLAEMGFKVVVIIDPGIKADPDYHITKQGLQGNHFLRYPDGELYIGSVWPGPSYFPDFSRAQTRQWWGSLFRDLIDVGAKGFWTDMNEPAVWGKAFPLEVIFDDGGHFSDQKKMHNLYGFLMAKATYEGVKRLQPDRRPFVLTRAGFAGEQRFTAVWTGDNAASEEHLELGIRMLQGLGLSGVPFVGTDVGGFIGTPSQELYARWIQTGAFSPLFRSHTHYGSNDQEPWSFGENIEMINRQFISLRYQMMPYLYSLFYESSRNGAPLLRPLFWHDQTDPQTYNTAYQHQFFVGEKLLLAPVTRVGHYLKKVYLPGGKWLDYNTEKTYEGPTHIIVEAPLDHLPMFLREGAIIPRRETVQYIEEQPLNHLIVDIFPAASQGEFLLYEDDGISFDYLNGEYRLTALQYQRSEKQLRFQTKRLHDQFRTPRRRWEIRFHGIEQAPSRILAGKVQLKPVQSDQKKSGYFFEEQKHVITVVTETEPPEIILIF